MKYLVKNLVKKLFLFNFFYIIKMSKKKISEMEEEIRKLKEERRQTVKKSRKLVDQVNDFQENLGKDLVPMQKIGLYVFFILALGIGIGLCVYSTHSGTSSASAGGTTVTVNTKNDAMQNMELGIGIGIIVFAFIGLIGGLYYLSSVEKSPQLAKINALGFEIGMVRDIVSPRQN